MPTPPVPYDKLIWNALAPHSTEGQTFTPEDIAVYAWQAYPATFGMRGYPAYPDLSKVCACIYGPRGMASHGFLLRIGPRQYQLGQQPIRDDVSKYERQLPDGYLVRSLNQTLAYLTRTLAYRLASEGNQKDVCVRDTLEFLQVKTLNELHSASNELHKRLKAMCGHPGRYSHQKVRTALVAYHAITPFVNRLCSPSNETPYESNEGFSA